MAIGRPVSLTSNIASKVVSVVSTAGQTVYTVSGGYTINQLSVFRNGIRLSQGKDYTASDGSTVTLLSAANAVDNIEFEVFDSFQVADAITSSGTDQVLSSNLDVQGNLTAVTHIGNVTGTAATFTTITVNDQISGNITGTAATFTGNVTIGGTLTYEDVTNIDSVGLVTARTGVRVTAGGLVVTAGVSTFTDNVILNANLDLQDDDKILLGSGDDLEIYHTGSHSFIVDSGVGSLYIRASAGNIQDQGNANQSWLQFNSGAGVEAHFAGNKKFETTTNGVTVTGTTISNQLNVSGVSTFSADISIADTIVHTGDPNTKIRFPAADTITAEAGGVERLRIVSDGGTTALNNIILNEDGQLGIGTDNPTYKVSIKDTKADGTGVQLHLWNNSVNNTAGNVWSGIRFTGSTGDYETAEIKGWRVHPGTNLNSLSINTGGVERMVVSTNGIGIGTDNPSAKLHVSDGANGLEFNPNSRNAVVSYNRTTSAYAPNGLQGSSVALRIGGIGTAIQVESNGRVAIGTQFPSDIDHTLCVAGTDNTTSLTGGHNQGIQLQNKSTTDGTYSQIEWRTAAGGRYARIAGIQDDANGNGGQLALLTENSSGSTVEALRITSGGNVNIGGNYDETSHPLNISDSTKPSICLHTGTTQRADFSATSGITSIRSFSNSPFTINIGGSGETEALRITASGDVGLGVDPSYEFHVKGAGTVAYFEGTGGNSFIGLEDADDSTVAFIGCDGGSLKFQTSGSSFSDKLVITADGLLGIGTPAPNEELHIHANGTSYIRFTDEVSGTGATDGVVFGLDNTDLYAWNYEAGDFVVAADAKERFRVQSDGNIRYKPNGDTSEANMLFTRNGDYIQLQAQKDGSDGAGFKFQTQNSGVLTEKFSIDKDGAVQINYGGGGYATLFRYGSNEDNYITQGASGTTTFRNHSNTNYGKIYSSGYINFGGHLGSTTIHRFNGFNATQGTHIATISGYQASNGSSQDTILFNAVNSSGTANASGCASKVYRHDTTLRSFNCAGTVNTSGNDYAEYMIKASDFTIAKGDICGVNAQGKLTNVFAGAVTFVVKSTDPSYVGGDTWDTAAGEEPGGYNDTRTGEELEAAKVAYQEQLEAVRQTVDRIAFSGQTPVNVTGPVTPGQHIIPTANSDGSISGTAKSEGDLTLAEYMSSVGKVIAIEEDGRARIIVKVA